MSILFILISHIVFVTTGFPISYVRRFAENYNFDDIESYLPKYDDLPHYSRNNLDDDVLAKYNEVGGNDAQKIRDSYELTEENSTYVTIYSVDSFTTDRAQISENMTVRDENITSFNNIYQLETNFEFSSSELKGANRSARQDLNDTENDPEFESQEEDSSEENENMVTSLLSAFLGGFSRPDGSIDLDAIIGILGSLSVQNDNGSYNFQGLTDLLRGFFGGGGDEGGGSDLGAFVGGLLGALIKGVANPPGAKGAGIFTGKVVAEVLPALSGPAPPGEGMDDKLPPQGLDSGGFLSGLIKTIFNSSRATPEEGGGSSSNLFSVVFQLITSLLSSSSQ